ncbi:MAG: serine hydrolase domain-containing protein [Bacteroidota bacterium]|nr:serine hydrolase domain-containing protein [Bacteroidota bacterium]
MIALKRILLTVLLAAMVSYDPGAIEKSGNAPGKVVPANIRLTNTFSSGTEFDGCSKLIGSFMKKWSIEGASIAIARDGKLVFAKGFGYADTASGTEVQPYSKFRIASISKLVTAIAIMKLTEEGKLSLDDKVFGPEGILNDSIYCHPKDKRVFSITVSHLLSHEGGWSQRWGDQMFMPFVVAEQMKVSLPVDTKTIVRFALSKKLHFTPGTGRSYSNLGYSILSLVIEKVTGMAYADFCQKEILEPLGIYDMVLAKNMPDQKAPFEVTYYEPSDMPLKPSIYGTGEMVPAYYGGNDIEALEGAGSWLATAPDLLRLLLAVDGFDTRKDILDNESIRFMTDMSNKYAPIGWKITQMDGNWIRTGSFSGTAGMLKRQPDGISWVILLNSSSWNGPEIHSYMSRTMTRVLQQVKEWPQYDLFDNSLPLPIKIELAGIN